MQKNSYRIERQQILHMVNVNASAKTEKIAFMRWFVAVLTVASVYGAAFIALGYYRLSEEERQQGSSPALMLEFAAEPIAPVAETRAEIMQTASLPKVAEVGPQSPEEQEVPRHEALPKKAEQGLKKIEIKQKQKQQKQSKRLSAAPQIAAKIGKNFAAPRNSATDGFNGKNKHVWADQVYRKIQNVARRMQRGLPGVRGIAYIAFHYDNAGRIEVATIARSSGNSRIDTLAIKIVEQASPLPAPEMAGRKTIPVRMN